MTAEKDAETDGLSSPLRKERTCSMNGYRYAILVLSLLCLTSISANVQAFNFAIVCMSPKNGSDVHSHPIIPYSLHDQKLLNWAVGFGSALGTFPFSVAYTRFGAKYLLGAAGALSALLCVVTPYAAGQGLWPFFTVRLLHGIAYSADFAAIGLLCTKWSPLAQNAFYVSTLTSYSSLSSLITFLMSGYMCESSLGWPLIYYACAAAGLLLFLLWFLLFDESPQLSPFARAAEVRLVQAGKGEEEIRRVRRVPYRAIFGNAVCWTIWLNSFAEIATSFFLYTFVAKFHRNVLGFSLHDAGLMSALPSAIYIPLRIALGHLNDRISCMSNVPKMMLFNSIALILPALFYVANSFIGPELRVLSVAGFVCIYVCYAFSGGGFYKCATLATRQYSHFVIANIQFIKCVTLFAGPELFVRAIKDETDLTQWRTCFFVIAGLLVAAGVLFNFMVTDEPQKFTKSKGGDESAEQVKLNQTT